jgi:hypothetical protein
LACSDNTGDQVGLDPFSARCVKAIGECARGDERRHTGFDRRYGDVSTLLKELLSNPGGKGSRRGLSLRSDDLDSVGELYTENDFRQRGPLQR